MELVATLNYTSKANPLPEQRMNFLFKYKILEIPDLVRWYDIICIHCFSKPQKASQL